MSETKRDRWLRPEVGRDTSQREAAHRAPASTLCLVSHRFRFICLLIPKNASSTLRAEFRDTRYGGESLRYSEIDEAARRSYFTFACLREPVSRLLSGYQEISMRFESEPDLDPKRPFLLMDDGPDRFEAFLSEAEACLWDEHIQLQSDFVDGVRVDRYIRLVTFQQDLSEIYRALDLGPCPILPQRRSRQDRRERYHYDKFLLDEADLDAPTIARIERLLAADVRLYRAQARAAEAR